MRGRVLFSATLVRGHIAKFHIPYLKWFKEQGWETWVAAKNDYPDGVCDIPYCDHFVNVDFARNPFSVQTITAYRQLRNLFNKYKFDLVHTHTPVGSVLTRLAARDSRARGTKIIYTAHGLHFYSGAPLVNWLLWYPIERFMSGYADVLITINKEDYYCANKFAHCNVEYIPGVGIDLNRFNKKIDRIKKRRDINLTEDNFIILSIGDLNKNKNHGVLINALVYLPARVHLCIAGEGPLLGDLRDSAESLCVSDRVHFLGFRKDVPELLETCDLYCMPSLREGLPVSLIEAIASGTPCLASCARGCSDVLGELTEACSVKSNSPKGWGEAITKMLDYDVRAGLGPKLRDQARRFDINRIIIEYEEIYVKSLYY